MVTLPSIEFWRLHALDWALSWAADPSRDWVQHVDAYYRVRRGLRWRR